MFRFGRAGLKFAVFSICTGLSFGVAACSKSSDPRAVAGSNPDSTLDQILSARGGYVADCQYRDIRYMDAMGQDWDGGGEILIFMRVPSSCLDDALKGFGYSGKEIESPTEDPLNAEFAKYFGKDINLTKQRQYFLPQTMDCSYVEFDRTVDPAEVFVTCY